MGDFFYFSCWSSRFQAHFNRLLKVNLSKQWEKGGGCGRGSPPKVGRFFTIYVGFGAISCILLGEILMVIQASGASKGECVGDITIFTIHVGMIVRFYAHFWWIF